MTWNREAEEVRSRFSRYAFAAVKALLDGLTHYCIVNLKKIMCFITLQTHAPSFTECFLSIDVDITELITDNSAVDQVFLLGEGQHVPAAADLR